MDKELLNNLLEGVLQTANDAGKVILEKYRQLDDVKIQRKKDASPVTEADIASHHIIVESLNNLPKRYPILSEEEAVLDYTTRKRWERYWLIDPLDGTREFIKQNDDFAVNIALIEGNETILGVVLVPVTTECYYAIKGCGAYKFSQQEERKPIRTQIPLPDPIRVVASRSHGEGALVDFFKQLPNYTRMHKGSALKICLVAEGLADVYPRFGPTSEWDTAAAQIILEEAGGGLTDINLNRLKYNTKPNLLNPSFLAVGDPNFDWALFLNTD